MTTSYSRSADGSQKRNNNSERYIMRHYPGADYATTQFVDKLRHRSAESQSLNRMASSDLMKDVYKTMPTQQASQQTRRMPAANVNELSPGYNVNYSQYSDVNVTAVREAKKREAMARGNANINVNAYGGSPARPNNVRRQTAMNTPARQNANASRQPVKAAAANNRQAQPVRYEKNTQARPAAPVPVKRKAPVKAPEPVNVKFKRPDASGQLAESGPREAIFKRVPFPKLAIMVILLSLIFFLMVHSIVKNFEYQREIADLESQLDTLNVRAAELKLELEARDDIAEIENRAEEIGMIKSGRVEEKYISLDNSDVIENFGEEDVGYGSFTTMLSAVSRQLSKFLGE